MRQKFYLAFFLCVTLPFGAFFVFDKHPDFFGSLVPMAASASCGFILLQNWEKKMQSAVRFLVDERLCEKEIAIVKKNKELEEHCQKSRNCYEDLKSQYIRLQEELKRQAEESDNQLKHKDLLLSEYQHTIFEQRAIIEKKQRYIVKLEGKIEDLSYEIRSLLQMEEPKETKEVPQKPKEEVIHYYLPKEKITPYDLAIHLQHYVEMAESFKGVNQLGGSTLLDLSLESYALDQRLLFDALREETTGIIFVYSQIENRLVFANNYTKTALHISPEKMIKEFQDLVVEGFNEWKTKISLLQKEAELPLSILDKNDNRHSFKCFMKPISKGPFTRYVIGLLGEH